MRRREYPRAQHRRCKLGELVQVMSKEPRRGDAVIGSSRCFLRDVASPKLLSSWGWESPGLRLRRGNRSCDGVAPSGRSLCSWRDLGIEPHSVARTLGVWRDLVIEPHSVARTLGVWRDLVIEPHSVVRTLGVWRDLVIKPYSVGRSAGWVGVGREADPPKLRGASLGVAVS